jgi:hypothetical protein
MFAYEDPEWQRIKASWLYHLAHTDPVHANLAIVRLYFDAFWWWGDYLEFRPFCEEILEEWRVKWHSEESREWQTLVEKFHHAYPWGWEKEKRGGEAEWQTVEATLLELRKLGGFDGDTTSFEDDDERRHIRFMTNLYLAQSRLYRNRNDPQADIYCQEALDILENNDTGNDDNWYIPWVKWIMSDLALSRGEYDNALTLAAESRQLAFELGEKIIDQDLEIIADDYRVEADVYFEKGELEKAFQNYSRALFFAWGFHAVGNPPDFYTREFHNEMITRTRRRLQELWYSSKRRETEQACLSIHEFWQPYWQESGLQSNVSDIPRLLHEAAWDELETRLFPLRPTEEEIEAGKESQYFKLTLHLFGQMFTALYQEN